MSPGAYPNRAIYAFDASQNYQYRAFGVPDLGYKRDLPDDLVVTPYASLAWVVSASRKRC